MEMVAMSAAEYAIFRERSVREFGATRAETEGMTAEAGLASAQEQFARILPEGQATPGQFFYHLKSDGLAMGQLWFGIRSENGRQKIFIFDISMDERHRGSGGGSFMLKWLEGKTRELGFGEIALHVFGSNTGARRLYERLGFETTSVYMAKKV